MPFEAVRVINNSLQLLQEGLKISTSITRATMIFYSRRYCDRPDLEVDGSVEETSHFQKEPEAATRTTTTYK